MNKSFQASVVELFDSIQGEGRYIGAKQLFVRLSGCPLNCPYCDTDHSPRRSFMINGTAVANPVSADRLAAVIRENYDLKCYHSISFTGGEPLLYEGFLRETALLLRQDIKFFLETSGHEPGLLTEAAAYFDYMSVDLKGHIKLFEIHADKLLSAVGLLNQDQIYVKIPLSAQDDEIVSISAPLFKKYAVKRVWLQPVDNIYSIEQVSVWQCLFAKYGVDAFFIPQMHKLMDIP